jgi:hypothetical protein
MSLAVLAIVVVEAVSALAQVFPADAPKGAPVAQLEAARGEWEAFQIVVRGPARAVRASAGKLRGPDAAALDAPRLYRVGYLVVTTPSSVEGHTGPWPDPLIPDVDAYAGERRNAFPFDVPAGEARAIWVELFVPEGQTPGAYRGAVTVTTDGGAAEMPIELRVRRFVLPRSSSIPVTFGIDPGAVARAHGRPRDDPIVTRYYVAALRHRVSLHTGGSLDPPHFKEKDGKVTVDFRAYDAAIGPFLDGSADAGGPAAGARFTAIDLVVPHRLDEAARAAYTRAVVEHFRARGWLDRLFDYTMDEPKPAQYPEVRMRAARIAATAPEVPRLVTRPRVPELDGFVDIWCPVVNWVDDKPGNSHWPPRSAYPGRIWWYQACMSHGCNIVGGDYFTGWPSYAIDAPAVAHRILEWLSFRYDVGGELYFETVQAYANGLDPWRDQRAHGGNGDGTLFYPGRPDVIGGRTDVPVESIRLKLIRDGLEDYEYLRLHAARYGKDRTLAIVKSVAKRTYEWEHDPARLEAARRRIADELDASRARPRGRRRSGPSRSGTWRRCRSRWSGSRRGRTSPSGRRRRGAG